MQHSKCLAPASGCGLSPAGEPFVTDSGNRILDCKLGSLPPLPAPIQNHTTYVAAVLTKSAAPGPAAAFVRHISTPASRAVFAATGVE